MRAFSTSLVVSLAAVTFAVGISTACNKAGLTGANGKRDPEGTDTATGTDGGTSTDPVVGSRTGPGAGTGTATHTATTPSTGGTAACSDILADTYKKVGPHTCEGCPSSETRIQSFTRTINGDSTIAVGDNETGTIVGHQGASIWCLASLDGEGTNSGRLSVSDGGDFDQRLPLFCGKQSLRLAFFGDTPDKRYVITYDVDRKDCTKGGLRMTLSWGAGARDFELHLIRKGGTINNTDGGPVNDCTWTSCINAHPDWGVTGDEADNPAKDVDWVAESGTENIFLTKLEPTTYDVYVEYWADGAPMAGKLVFNAFGKTTEHESPVLSPKQVWHAGVVDGAAGTLNLLDDVIDCAADWSGGCRAKLP